MTNVPRFVIPKFKDNNKYEEPLYIEIDETSNSIVYTIVDIYDKSNWVTRLLPKEICMNCINCDELEDCNNLLIPSLWEYDLSEDAISIHFTIH